MIRRGGSRRARGTRPYGSAFAAAMRSMGAIAHFDPSVRATDDGTTSTWTDRIAGHAAASTSQATRLIYSGPAAGFNNRPGWTGSAANATKLVISSSALATFLDGSQPYSLYSVRKAASIATFNMLFCVGSSALTEYIYHATGPASGSNFVTRRDSVGQTQNVGLVEAGSTATVDSYVYSGSASLQYTNGGPALIGAANTRTPVSNMCVIGALVSGGVYSLSFDGLIGDIIIFPTAHTDAQRRYVEQLIAAKYGWPCIQGLSGFTTADFLYTALNGGVTGATGVGVWSDSLVRYDALPSGTLYTQAINDGAQGWGLIGTPNPAHLGKIVSVNYISPTSAVAAADIGKLWLSGGTCDLSFSRGYKNGVESGAGTAMAGYTRTLSNSTVRHIVGGQATGGPNSSTLCQTPAANITIFGAAGGDVAQNTANQAARAAAIKAAGRFVATGGATPTHAWALLDDGATFADLVGSDVLTTAGTLSRAQIIVPTWPW